MKRISLLFRKLFCIGIVWGISATGYALDSDAGNCPYQDSGLSPEQRAEDLLHRLTLEEKVALMQNVSPAIARLGIPAYDWWNEALHGVGRAGLATVFPQSIGMAASFDDTMVRRVFDAVSDEARAKHHDAKRIGSAERYWGLTFWTPNVNLFRDPRWGRGQETYGEDPYLSGRMGVAVVQGLQGEDARYDKLHACAKHFAVHSGPEWNRHSFNADHIDWRDLWESYLPAFKALVTEAKVKEVMCAYNRFEGEPCCGSKRLLMEILREEWKYEGIVVSDCGAISDFYLPGRHETHPSKESASAGAVISGTDLECGDVYASLVEAVRQGKIDEAQIDISVFRLLKARFELGAMDPDTLVGWASIPMSVVDSKEHRTLALDMARKSMTLLKNNGVLPLSKSLQKVAVIGPNAADSVMMWGNYNGTPSHTETILDGIKAKLPAGTVVYDKGCNYIDNDVFYSCFDRCFSDGKVGFSSEYWNNRHFSGPVAATAHVSTPFDFHTDGNTVYAPGVSLQNFTARYDAEFVPETAGEYTLYITGDDGYRIFVDGEKVIDHWGEHGPESREYTLSAEAGKPYRIAIEYMQGGGGGELKFDLGYYRKTDPKSLLDRLSDVDIVVFAGGISPRLEGEEMPVSLPGFRGGDRTDIELPQAQRDLIGALKAGGKKVIFVNCSGSAVALEPESIHADAILQAWYPGQAGGTAVADVIFGDYNPGGRLPVTFYKHIGQLPDYEDYSMKGRTYRFMDEEPLYPFGYGLSYTRFEYGKAKMPKTVKANTAIRISVPLKNSGKMAGDEVVQIYVRNLQDPDGAVKTLRAFRRVTLDAGERQQIVFDLPGSTFEFYDTTTNTMRVTPGRYQLMYGGSSSDKDLKKITVTVK